MTLRRDLEHMLSHSLPIALKSLVAPLLNMALERASGSLLFECLLTFEECIRNAYKLRLQQCTLLCRSLERLLLRLRQELSVLDGPSRSRALESPLFSLFPQLLLVSTSERAHLLFQATTLGVQLRIRVAQRPKLHAKLLTPRLRGGQLGLKIVVAAHRDGKRVPHRLELSAQRLHDFPVVCTCCVQLEVELINLRQKFSCLVCHPSLQGVILIIELVRRARHQSAHLLVLCETPLAICSGAGRDCSVTRPKVGFLGLLVPVHRLMIAARRQP
jgi:hypothetical protein